MTRGNDSSDSDPVSGIDSRRRHLLAALGTGVAGGIAGCGSNNAPTDTSGGDGGSTDASGDGGSTDASGDGGVGNTATDSGTQTPTGQLPDTSRTYKTFMDADLANMTWDVTNHREDWPRFVSKFTFGYKASRDQDTGELIPMIVKDWKQTDTKLEFTLRDDTHWYVGNPNEGGKVGDKIKARDWGVAMQIDRWRGPSPSTVQQKENYPRSWFEGVTDISWSGQKLTIKSEPGHFADFFMDPVIRGMLTEPTDRSQGDKFTTKADVHHMDRYERFKGMNWEERRKKLKALSNDTSTPKPPEDPTQIPTSGPFTLTDVGEAKVTLRPNPGYYNSDRINWDKVELTAMQQKQQRNQALTSGRLDGINGQVYTPAGNILDQLPDHFKTYLHNKSGTSGIALHAQNVEWFSDPRVRQAIMFALDKERLARQGHKYANKAPEKPPGLIAPSYRKYVPKDLYSSYEVYQQDTKKAAELLRTAGFSKSGGTWKTPKGNPFKFSFLANNQNVQVPALIQQDLRQFGIQVTLNTQGSTQVDNRKGRGEFQMAMQGWWIQHIGLWTRAIQQSDRRHRFGSLISDKEVQEWTEKYSDQGVVNKQYEWTNNLENWSPEMMKDFTLKVPPVGERSMNPDDWRDVPVYYYAHTWGRALSDKKRKKWMKELSWATNWYLPYLPFAISAQVAVQNQRDWNAPNDNKEWLQHAPINKLIGQGKITAAAEE